MTFKRIGYSMAFLRQSWDEKYTVPEAASIFADLEYGYEKPSVFEVAMLCLTFGEKLSVWRRAAPDVDYIVRCYEYNGLNRIDDLMAQLADKYGFTV